jgi:hypothetical protein
MPMALFLFGQAKRKEESKEPNEHFVTLHLT